MKNNEQRTNSGRSTLTRGCRWKAHPGRVYRLSCRSTQAHQLSRVSIPNFRLGGAAENEEKKECVGHELCRC